MSENSIENIIGATGFTAITYPFVRLQTQMQTQFGYSTINNNLKFTNLSESFNLAVREGMGGVYRGVAFAAANNSVKASVAFLYWKLFSGTVSLNTILQSSVIALISSGVAYPLELLQVRSASSLNSGQGDQILRFSDHVNANTFTNIKNWTAFPLLFGKTLYLGAISYTILSQSFSTWLVAGLGLGAVPFDVIRRNLMISQWEGNSQIKSIKDCTSHILKTQGPKGFFRGFLLYPEIYLIGLLATRTNQH